VEPTVAAAWIAAGSGFFGAVVGVSGAVLGAMFSRRASRDSTAQTIEADKANRVWEKKSDTYTDALAGILHRMKVRDCQRQRMMTDTESEQPSPPVNWPLVEARLFAYASDDVLKALDQADKANSEFDAVLHKWVADYEQTQADPPPPPGIGLQAAQQTGNPPDAVEKAFPKADEMDHTLMITIRNELQRGPDPAQSVHKPG
jgi:hypothetical protein